MNFGYCRVSTQDQNLDRQIDLLKEQDIHRANIYMEKITGTKKDRPALNELLSKVEKNDVLIVTELSRLSRSTKDLIDIAEQLRQKGVELVSLKENLDTTTAAGKAMFGMLAVMAQFERDLISERVVQGLKSARARGRVGGRPTVNNDNIRRALLLYDSNTLSVGDICKMCNISKNTLYNYIRKRKDAKEV